MGPTLVSYLRGARAGALGIVVAVTAPAAVAAVVGGGAAAAAATAVSGLGWTRQKGEEMSGAPAPAA